MIGLDTNILVRYIAQDDPVQSPIATRIIEDRLSEEHPGFISLITMTETVWVLDRSYGLSAAEIAAAIERILQIDSFFVQNECSQQWSHSRPEQAHSLTLLLARWARRQGALLR
jgi:predicted nucleic-acid-binding protein